MIKDPFYRSILEGLHKKLDPDVFEHCASDLLSKEWPTLVPVPGGADSGVDGIAALPQGPLLVTTTQKSVIENLKKSLKSYVKSGGKLRHAILATSQELTPKRRQNLENAALKARFRLRQIYTRQAIANRLYPNALWCQELLGLTGDPGALSLFPVTSRPLIGNTLIGREADLHWLLKTSADLLIVGQPGSGKTFLMHEAARQAGGLFVVDSDLGRIAADLRAKSPRFLVVDDAHLRTELVMNLRRLRQESRANFRILANCWPGDQEKSQRALEIGVASVRQLELLSRDDIIEILKQLGVTEPTGLIHELVNQADGRPGLAVTLCQLWLRGEVKQLASADALYADVRHTFAPLVGNHAMAILGVFAIGGDWGMSFEIVANYLRMSLGELHAAVAQLAFGGVLTDIAGERMSVRPAALRHALVRDVFFSGGKSLKVRPLLESVPNKDEATLTLIGARARGAPVPDELLHELVPVSSSAEAWSSFVRLGEAEAKWAVTANPSLLRSAGGAVLEVWPSGVIPLLLAAARVDTSQRLDSDHPMSLLKHWTESGMPGTGEAVFRRQQVIDRVIEWLRNDGNVDVALAAATSALSPGFEDVHSSPGSARAIQIRSGLLLATELDALKAMWVRLYPVLFERLPTNWSPLFSLIHNWLFPLKGPAIARTDLRDSMTTFALQIGNDVARVAKNRPGVLQMLVRTFARTKRKDFQVEVDPDFAILYPLRDIAADWQAEESAQVEAARALGSKWSNETPVVVAESLVQLEAEAAMAGITWPRRSPLVCEQIAQTTERPLDWALALRDAKARSDLLYPFLKRLALLGEEQPNDLLRACFDIPSLRWASVAAVLESTKPPSDLVELSFERLEGMGDWVEWSVARGNVSESVVDRLLRHLDAAISGAAAGALWHRDRLEAAKRAGWREAVVANTSERDYNLEEIFKALPEIALDWLLARMKTKADVFWMRSHLVDTSVSVLSLEQRRALLDEIPEHEYWTSDLIASVVGNDPNLYGELLQNVRLKGYHLSPLSAEPDEQWIAKALLAISAGYTAENVARAAIGSISGYHGSEAAMWTEWIDRFELLKQQPGEVIKDVGRIGADLARQEREPALARERAAAVHGFD